MMCRRNFPNYFNGRNTQNNMMRGRRTFGAANQYGISPVQIRHESDDLVDKEDIMVSKDTALPELVESSESVHISEAIDDKLEERLELPLLISDDLVENEETAMSEETHTADGIVDAGVSETSDNNPDDSLQKVLEEVDAMEAEDAVTISKEASPPDKAEDAESVQTPEPVYDNQDETLMSTLLALNASDNKEDITISEEMAPSIAAETVEYDPEPEAEECNTDSDEPSMQSPVACDVASPKREHHHNIFKEALLKKQLEDCLDGRGLLKYEEWWYRNLVEINVDGDLISGVAVFLEQNTLRVVNNKYSYFIPLNKISYIRTCDGFNPGY